MFLPTLQKFLSLQPNELSEVTASAVEDLLREGESKNTQASYRSALRYWAAWHACRYGIQLQLPLPVPCVLQFIVDHAERTTSQGLMSELPALVDQALVAAGYKGKLGALAHNTLVHRIAVLSKAHQMRELKNPCHDSQIRELLSRTRKAYAKRGALPVKKEALTKDPLELILATCDDSLRGRRDRALLLFAWSSGGRRRSEVASATMSYLKAVPGGYVYTLQNSKTNQSGADLPENVKPLLGPAAVALAAWLAEARIVDGPVFRRVLKGGKLGHALSAASVRDIVKARCIQAGVAGDFSAHSLRSGFVTEAGRQNVSLADTMAMTGHRSVNAVLGYFRSGALQANPGAKLLGD